MFWIILFKVYYPLDSTALSTIAVTVSPDGSTVASTHGDHSVKIFDFISQKQIRNLLGHPRTPWTAKFHPRNNNIIASGCLVGQVRIWDILANNCIRCLNYGVPVITISFHPSGEYLAVASGSILNIWDCKNDVTSKTVHHGRTIRALMFHPSGKFLFIAAPSGPRIDQLQFVQLFYCSFFTLLRDDCPEELTQFPVLIRNIHCYSDGGIDISRDGRHLVTCAFSHSGAPTATLADHEVNQNLDEDAIPCLQLPPASKGFNQYNAKPSKRLVDMSDAGLISSHESNESSVRVYELNMFSQEMGGESTVVATFVRQKPVGYQLMKAIVSAKFSFTGNFVLLGYGIRNSSRRVQDHPCPQVACEILRCGINKFETELSTAAIFTDHEDEVNISVVSLIPSLTLDDWWLMIDDSLVS